MAITVRGEKFEGYNKPKRTPQHATKSHAVLAKEGEKVRLIGSGSKVLPVLAINHAPRHRRPAVRASRPAMPRTSPRVL
jgi:hypothetical protein